MGFSKNVVLWCDDEIVTSSQMQRHSDYLIYQQYMDQQCMQTQYLYKSHSMMVRAYLDSIFFKISLQMCDNMTFVQNIHRKNDQLVKIERDKSRPLQEQCNH